MKEGRYYCIRHKGWHDGPSYAVGKGEVCTDCKFDIAYEDS